MGHHAPLPAPDIHGRRSGSPERCRRRSLDAAYAAVPCARTLALCGRIPASRSAAQPPCACFGLRSVEHRHNWCGPGTARCPIPGRGSRCSRGCSRLLVIATCLRGFARREPLGRPSQSQPRVGSRAPAASMRACPVPSVERLRFRRGLQKPGASLERGRRPLAQKLAKERHRVAHEP